VPPRRRGGAPGPPPRPPPRVVAGLDLGGMEEEVGVLSARAEIPR